MGTLSLSEIQEDVRVKITKARAIIIQGLGDKPLRAILTDRENPHLIWNRLNERYAISNIATRVQLQAKLTRMRCSGQVMSDYVASFEEVFNHLSGMNSPIEAGLQVAMFLSSFGEKNKSPYGHLITTIQSSQDELSWESVSAKMLQEYEEIYYEKGLRTDKKTSNQSGMALRTELRPIKNYNRRFENRRCFKCGKRSHIARNCRSLGNRGAEIKRNEKANTAILLISKVKDVVV